MSKYLKIVFLSLLVISIASCSKRKTYADYLKEERKAISSYIAANNIQVEYSKPEGNGKWATNDGKDIYWQTASSLYYHQIELGDGPIAPTTGWTAYVHYIGTTLSGTIVYNHTYNQTDPASFLISSSPSGKQFGAGFQEAVRNLRVGGHCRIIVPFNVGNGLNQTLAGTYISDAENYTPMIYDIWLLNLE
jgi:FKBP-type peptidyl-prolyl cis-trans isomerase